MGTNPLCFGIPSDEAFPFVIDCATSICQRGKIEKYARLGMSTPKGMVIDSNGEERTDTEGILKGMVKGECALTPLGGGKGLGPLGHETKCGVVGETGDGVREGACWCICRNAITISDC